MKILKTEQHLEHDCNEVVLFIISTSLYSPIICASSCPPRIVSAKPHFQQPLTMADSNVHFDETANQALPTFDIDLFPTGDPGSGFHFNRRNAPLSPDQRRQIMQRKDAFNIQCVSLDVIHGKFGTGSTAFATLIVLKFWFDKRRIGRRISSADICLEFSGMDPEGERPEVYAITPHERAALVPSVTHEEVMKEGTLHAGVNVHGAESSGNYTWRKTVTQDNHDATIVTGSIDLEGPWGEPNCASWTLLENEQKKTGVPSTLQVAVLLKRENMEKFQCTVDVKARADKKTSLEWLLGSKSHDDPVLFNPALGPTNKLRVYDTENLGAIMREPLWDAGLVGSQTTNVGANASQESAKAVPIS